MLDVGLRIAAFRSPMDGQPASRRTTPEVAGGFAPPWADRTSGEPERLQAAQGNERSISMPASGAGGRFPELGSAQDLAGLVDYSSSSWGTSPGELDA